MARRGRRHCGCLGHCLRHRESRRIKLARDGRREDGWQEIGRCPAPGSAAQQSRPFRLPIRPPWLSPVAINEHRPPIGRSAAAEAALRSAWAYDSGLARTGRSTMPRNSRQTGRSRRSRKHPPQKGRVPRRSGLALGSPVETCGSASALPKAGLPEPITRAAPFCGASTSRHVLERAQYALKRPSASIPPGQFGRVQGEPYRLAASIDGDSLR